MFSDDYEEILDAAAYHDERLHDSWMELMGEAEYQTLVQFFAKENFLDPWENEPLEPDVVSKNFKKILVGQDRIALIRFAFALGRLVGRAEQILRTED